MNMPTEKRHKLPLECRIVGEKYIRFPEHGLGWDVAGFEPYTKGSGIPEHERGVIALAGSRKQGWLFIYVADPSYTYRPDPASLDRKSLDCFGALFLLARFLEGWFSE